MNQEKETTRLMCLVVCLLVLAGCNRGAKDRDKAIAEAEQARAELARVETALEETRSERDGLKENIDEIYEELEEPKSKLLAAMQTQEKLENQLIKLTNQRNSAIEQAKEAGVQVATLNKQLKERIKENQDYEEWVEELQENIRNLEGRIEEMEEQSIEQLDEEVTDGNNV